jgi:hypothetical protein
LTISLPICIPFVRLKRGTEGKTGDRSTLAQALFGKGPVGGGSLARELEPTAENMLGLDIMEASGKVPGRARRNTIARQPRKVSCG